VSPEDVCTYRDSLEFGKFEVFGNKLGNKTGRAWSLDQSMSLIFTNPELVPLFNYNTDAPVGPTFGLVISQ